MKLIASAFTTLIASTFILTSVSLAAFIVQEDPAPPSDTAATPPADATDDDAVLESMPAPMQAQVKQMLAKLLTVKDPEKLRQALDAMDAQSAQMPEEAKPMFEYMKKKIQNRIDELTAAEATTETPAAATEETPATTETPAAATEETPATTETPAATETPATTETPAAAEAPAISAAVQKAIEDFLYGVLAGRKELAETNAKFILASDVSDQQLAQMLDDPTRQERLVRAVRAAKGMGEVGDLASQIEIRVAAGRLLLARDQSRIAMAVGQLGGTMRQQTMARATLTEAGAYAVPALLKAMLDPANAQLALRASQTMIDIGRPAVLPLCVVLVGAAPQEQIAICNMLTAINQKIAAPWLVKTIRLATTKDVRNAASTAVRALQIENLPEQTLWTNLARDYFVSRDKLTPYPEDKSQIMWSADATGTIVPKVVPTEIYGDLMAQQCAQESMLRDPKGAEALSIYLAAGLRIQSVAGADSTESSDPSIMSIALAAGPEQSERVLRLARQVNDPGLTLIAIHILAKTASETMLVDSKTGGPILSCLTNPSRAIRTAAALAIAWALPTNVFEGSERVVPILAAAVVQGREPRVIVIANDESQRRDLEGRLSQIHCTSLMSEASASAVLATLAGRGAPDLIIASGGANEMTAAITVLRSNPTLASTPIFLAIPVADEVRIDRAIRQDPTVMIWFQGRSDEQFQIAAKQLMTRTIGVVAIGEDGAAESLALQTETLEALRLIGELQKSPLKVSDAERDLIEALSTTTAQVQTRVARVLAVTPTQNAQRALLNAALAATPEQQIALLQSLAESGRRYGNKAEEKQIDRLRQALSDAKGANADALAQAYGALNLGTAQVLKLILK